MSIPPHIENKLLRLFWDLTPQGRTRLKNQIMNNPADIIPDHRICLRLLTGLSWWDLTGLFKQKDLLSLLDDDIIGKLYPEDLQFKYKNARRLLSKYSLPSAG